MRAADRLLLAWHSATWPSISPASDVRYESWHRGLWVWRQCQLNLSPSWQKFSIGFRWSHSEKPTWVWPTRTRLLSRPFGPKSASRQIPLEPMHWAGKCDTHDKDYNVFSWRAFDNFNSVRLVTLEISALFFLCVTETVDWVNKCNIRQRWIPARCFTHCNKPLWFLLLLRRMLTVYPQTKTYFAHWPDLSLGSGPVKNHGAKVMGGVAQAVKTIDELEKGLLELSEQHAYTLRVDPSNFKVRSNLGMQCRDLPLRALLR